MKKQFLKCLCFGVFSLMASISVAQMSEAHSMLASNSYDNAIVLYKQALSVDDNNLEAMLGLARTYAYTDNYLQSAKYFTKVESSANLAKDDILLSADVLRKMGKYDLAKQQYQKLENIDRSLAEHYSLSCNYAEMLLSQQAEYMVAPMDGNTSEEDFAYAESKMTKTWTQSFPPIEKTLPRDNRSVCPYNLKFIQNNDITIDIEEEVIPNSSLTYCWMMMDMAFVSDDAIFMNCLQPAIYKPQELEKNSCGLYTGTIINGLIQKGTKAFPHNQFEYAVVHPSISNDGNVLFFAANIPGGFGGFDIYRSNRVNNKWSIPENLGPTINSKGNELTPDYDGTTLYFSSDYLHGLGGFDIFKSESYNGRFTFPSNMGAGVNSPEDDVFPFHNVRDGFLYFSSNRLGSNGGLDIYKATKIEVDYSPELAQLDHSSTPQKLQVALNQPADKEITSTHPDAVSEISVSTTNFVLPEEVEIGSSEWEGAMMGRFDESLWNGTPVFFIQLAATKKPKPDAGQYSKLSKYGNIYALNTGANTKIRLGYYFDESEARAVLSSVKSKGYGDAFITRQPLDTKELKLMVTNTSYTTDSYMVPSKFKGTSEYKVRLASYKNPKWFNIDKAKDIGKIEQWSKGGWTIFVLSGFKSQDDAARARVRAINKGFVDAQVVFDNNGILEKIEKN